MDTLYPSETAEIMANSVGARIAKAKQLVDELKNEVAALMNTRTARGTRSRGYVEACIEDGETSFLMALDEIQKETTSWYAVEQ